MENRISVLEYRPSGFEDEIYELEYSYATQYLIKGKNNHKQSISVIISWEENWVTGIEKNLEIQAKGFKNIFNEIVTENSPHVKNVIDILIQKATGPPNKQEQK